MLKAQLRQNNESKSYCTQSEHRHADAEMKRTLVRRSSEFIWRRVWVKGAAPNPNPNLIAATLESAIPGIRPLLVFQLGAQRRVRRSSNPTSRATVIEGSGVGRSSENVQNLAGRFATLSLVYFCVKATLKNAICSLKITTNVMTRDWFKRWDQLKEG
jgi:hypothetical protein